MSHLNFLVWAVLCSALSFFISDWRQKTNQDRIGEPGPHNFALEWFWLVVCCALAFLAIGIFIYGAAHYDG